MLLLQWFEQIERLMLRRTRARAVVVLLVHAAVFVGCYWAAYVIRHAMPLPPHAIALFWQTLPVLLAVKLATFYLLGHWHLSWRHATFSELAALLRAATLSLLILATINLMSGKFQVHVPRLVLALDWALTILVLGGLRAMWRLSREELRMLLARNNCRKALIVGADAAGEALARQLLHSATLNYLAAGFLDDDESRHGSRLGGVPILGKPEDAVRLAERVGASEILVISGVLTGQRLRALMESCATATLALKVIPGTDGLLAGDYTVHIRDVHINDLLRREPVVLNDEAIRALVAGQSVLVTGAGGSIGAEICRQVLKFQPSCLVLVERAENNLFLIERELAALGHGVETAAVLGDITDRGRMEYVFEQHRPTVVFHAAAHKHVPMMEANPGEAIKNNVLGTVALAELADDYGVHEFVFISTDKSVNAVSVMGVSKQLAERYVHALSKLATTKFVVVRFGNVLASAGSVVPIFQEQIRQGGPITITHPEMERYFMTIPEASQLVLQAAAMGKGGEIFVLDMGAPVKIVDLAHDLIRLSRLSLDDVEIVFTGMRPGEKLREELYFSDEQMLPTVHPKVRIASHRPCELSEVRDAIRRVEALVDGPPELLRQALEDLLAEYQTPPPASHLQLEAKASAPVQPSPDRNRIAPE